MEGREETAKKADSETSEAASCEIEENKHMLRRTASVARSAESETKVSVLPASFWPQLRYRPSFDGKQASPPHPV